MTLLIKSVSILLLVTAMAISIVSLTAVLRALILREREPSSVFIPIWLVCVVSYQLYPKPIPTWTKIAFAICLSMTIIEATLTFVGHVSKHLIQRSRIHEVAHEGYLHEGRYAQWSFARFFAGWLVAGTNAVGGFQYLYNWLFVAIVAVPVHLLIGPFIEGFAWKCVSLLVAMLCSVFLLWLAMYRIIRTKLEFPLCDSGECHGIADFNYRFGTWLGLAGWRKWEFVCRCGHVYQVDHGEWKHLGDLDQYDKAAHE